MLVIDDYLMIKNCTHLMIARLIPMSGKENWICINKIDKMDEADKAAMEALFSKLDKGIDDVKAGSVLPVEKRFG